MKYRSGRAKPGEGLEWIDSHINHTGAECLLWPFGRNGDYPHVMYEGKSTGVHRVMCIKVHGPPPFVGAMATHDCGKGYDGCVNPLHLSWGSARKNKLDCRLHGTHLLGARNHNHVLTPEIARLILSRRYTLSQDKLAKIYGVSQYTISQIMLGRHWTIRNDP